MENIEGVQVQRKYKDTMFRMIFREKENLLSLYNAVNGTHYTNLEKLKITTLENAIYMNYKNDVSFVFDFELLIYEHQSTVNANMPLRDLIYVTKVLQGLIQGQNLYSSRQIKLPTPRFVIFYNGMDFQPKRQVLRLSDAYEKKMENPELELAVTMYNINYGCNPELLEACRLLKEYAQYVQKVRELAKRVPLSEAVEQAVDFCIQEGILADFLRKNRAEAIAMSIFEYNEAEHIRSEREISYQNGYDEGKEKGMEQGIQQGIRALIEICQDLEMGKDDTMEKIKEKFSISEDYAIELMNEYWR